MKVSTASIAKRIGVDEFSQTDLARRLSRMPPVASGGPWLAGGAVRRTIQGISLDSDYDFFFRDAAQKDDFIANAKAMGASVYGTNSKNTTLVIPSKIITDIDGKNIKLPELKLQAIHFAYYDSPEAVIDSFDFTLCQFAFDGNAIFMGEFSLWDVARKKIVPHRLSYATSSVRRLLKYSSQGFTACGGCISEVLQQVVANPSIIEADTLYID